MNTILLIIFFINNTIINTYIYIQILDVTSKNNSLMINKSSNMNLLF